MPYLQKKTLILLNKDTFLLTCTLIFFLKCIYYGLSRPQSIRFTTHYDVIVGLIVIETVLYNQVIINTQIV